MNPPRQEAGRSEDEPVTGRSARHPHLRLRKSHRTRSALSTLREELKSLYDELSAALLPDGKGKR
jgi:hypothetical protein